MSKTTENPCVEHKMTEWQLTEEVLAALREDFFSDDKNRLAQHFSLRTNPLEASINWRCLEDTVHTYNHRVTVEGKPVSNQKASGRCWLFACLNVARLPFMKQHNLEEFEFSQAHLYYWDKIERANYFLHNIVSTARRGEPTDSRTVSYLLSKPVNDGGQWDM